MPRWDVEIELVRWIGSLGGRSWFVDHLALALVSNPLFRAVPYVVILVAYWTAAGEGDHGRAVQRKVLAGFLASGVGLIASRLIQNLFLTIRPIDDPALSGLFHPLFRPLDLHSFPSDHAAMLVPLAWTIGALGLLFGAAAGLLLLCAMAARIWAGLHYPTDILAGALLGLGTLWVLRLRREPVDRLLDVLNWGRSRWPVAVGAALFLTAFLYASMFESLRTFVEAALRAHWRW